MNDFVNLDISYIGAQFLLDSPKIRFYEYNKTDLQTGELILKEIRYRRRKCEYYGELGNLRIFIYKNGEINLEGSLHKFFNKGLHNHNDFTICNLIQVINELRTIGIDPNRTKIKHLEYAVNLIDLPFSTPKIIDNLMIHTGKGAPQKFKHKSLNTPSDFITIEPRDNFTLKIYDKAKQYGLKVNNFRFEVKQTKGSVLKKIGLNFLSDLLDPKILESLGSLLLKRWDEVLLDDWTIRENELSIKEKINLKDYTNHKYWIKLHKETREKNRNKYSQTIKRYKKLVQDHSKNVHHRIRSEIAKKWCKITSKEDVSINIEKVQDHHYIVCDHAPNPSQNTRISNLQNLEENKSTIGPLNRELKIMEITKEKPKKENQERKYCKVTGIEITNQRKGSFLLRESTLRQICCVSDPLIYSFINWNYGPLNGYLMDKEKEFRVISKNVRNRYLKQISN